MPKREITDYGKIKLFISSIIRCRTIFISEKRISNKKLLNIGCGDNVRKDFINLDYNWRKGQELCWDITQKPIPLKENTLEGIYTEHCLEHISLNDCRKLLKQLYRLLKKDGIFRIVVPDGELYLDIYHKKKNGENVKMPYEESYITPMDRINGLFRGHGHLFIYDFNTMKKILFEAGFRKITKSSYMTGNNKKMLIDTEWRKNESLYIEAIK